MTHRHLPLRTTATSALARAAAAFCIDRMRALTAGSSAQHPLHASEARGGSEILSLPEPHRRNISLQSQHPEAAGCLSRHASHSGSDIWAIYSSSSASASERYQDSFPMLFPCHMSHVICHMFHLYCLAENLALIYTTRTHDSNIHQDTYSPSSPPLTSPTYLTSICTRQGDGG